MSRKSMESKLQEDVKYNESVCRLCLKSTERMENFFNSNYYLIVEDLIGLKLEHVIELPSLICQKCRDIINVLLDFRETCKISQEILKVHLQNVEIKSINNERENSVANTLNIKYERRTTVDKEGHLNNEFISTGSKINSKNKNTNKKSKKSIKDLSESNKIVKINSSSRETPCYVCGKVINKFRMEYHLNIHFDRRPFKCNIEDCGKAFASPRQLRQHNTYIHSEKEPFECDICGRRYKTNSTLKMHKTYHFDPELPCTVCGKLLRNRKAMKMHMLSHSEERPYKCDLCLKSFKTHWSLKVHMRRIHRKAGPIICDVCDISLGHNTDLKKHIKKCHPESELSFTQESVEEQEKIVEAR